MRLRLAPRESSIHDMVGGLADNVHLASEALVSVFRPGAPVADLAARLRDLEHVGDDAVHALARRVNRTFVTPFAREDIIRLASDLDDVLDHMEAAAKRAVLYRITVFPEGFAALAEVIERAARAVGEAVSRLRRLDGLETPLIAIHRLENEADDLYHGVLADLFAAGDNALGVLKLKEVADELEGAADACERVAATIEMIAIKES